jgi:hypothetical protein
MTDRMECSEASAAQLHGGGDGDGGGGGGGAEQEAGRRGAGCEGLPESATVVTTRNEDVQLGELDSVDDERDDWLHGVGIRGIAAVDAHNAGGLGEAHPLCEGLHTRLEQDPQPAGGGDVGRNGGVGCDDDGGGGGGGGCDGSGDGGGGGWSSPERAATADGGRSREAKGPARAAKGLGVENGGGS